MPVLALIPQLLATPSTSYLHNPPLCPTFFMHALTSMYSATHLPHVFTHQIPGGSSWQAI
jgi:hypothetical protein